MPDLLSPFDFGVVLGNVAIPSSMVLGLLSLVGFGSMFRDACSSGSLGFDLQSTVRFDFSFGSTGNPCLLLLTLLLMAVCSCVLGGIGAPGF